MKNRNYLLFCILMSILAPIANAQTDKAINCPEVKRIKIVRTTPFRYLLVAYNKDGKYFVSDEQQYNENNGPAPPVHFVDELTEYSAAEKKLSCVYYAYHYFNTHPSLVNIGDY